MTPIRVDTAAVEPVSVAELRLYLRLDPEDAGVEDDLLATLIAAARASLETQARRVLVPGRYRLVREGWPPEGWLSVPLSPLVAILRVGLVGADGTATDLPAGSVRLGPDPVEAPGLQFVGDLPDPGEGRIVVEVAAGFGGDGPPLPAPLRLAVLRLAAARYEHRGDEPDDAAAEVERLAAPLRRLRL